MLRVIGFLALFPVAAALAGGISAECTHDAPPDWMAVSDPHAAQVRPADCAAVEQTPPDFSWPDIARDARYEVTLIYPGGRKKTLAAPQNYLNWNEVLPAGEYSWQVKAVSTRGTQESRVRKFLVSEKSKPFLLPDMKELSATLAAKSHPRGLPDAQTLKKMADQRSAGLATLLREVNGKTRNPLPGEPNHPNPGTNDASVFDEVKRTLNSLQAYALTREERYYADALRRVRNLASWDPKGKTAFTERGMDRSARFLTFTLALGYDWLHPRLDEATKSQLTAVLKVRMGQMYGDLVGERSRIAAQPRDSHGIQTSIYLAAMLPLVAGDVAGADAWMARALPLALSLISPWAGEEGGFANGSAYSLWGMGDALLYFYVLRWTTGIDVAQKPWVRNWGRYMAYFDPPGSPARLFGDGHEQAALNEARARYGKGYAAFSPTPLGQWWASRLSGEDASRAEFLLSPLNENRKAALPEGTPNSLYLPSIGWVAMHSSLADDARSSVYFKSAPPPFGAFNHSHADQNGFVVNAGGQRLAIESGYYDAYKSAHWMKWLHQTRSKNAITYDGGKGQLFFEQDDKEGYGGVTRFASAAGYDIVSGDATRAYGGAVSAALRTLVYLRPDVVVVYDRLASSTPRQWDWNIHALNQMERSGKSITIRNGG
ncbi:MAG TPA: DUF4962 domain-containing protein, partial [Burkholderiales bacterium]|nr:DUF4962 domain-containing protein [Burkholderiales bacterium]